MYVNTMCSTDTEYQNNIHEILSCNSMVGVSCSGLLERSNQSRLGFSDEGG